MADDEDVMVEQSEFDRKKKERPFRRQILKECDVSKTGADEIIEFAQQALDDTPAEGYTQKDVAQKLKAKLDKEKGGTWHVIVGSHFGGNITNDANTLLNFQLDNTWFLVFRSGPPEKSSAHK